MSDQDKRFNGVLEEIYLEPFLNDPTEMKAKQVFVAYHEKGLSVPEEILVFLSRIFRQEIATHDDKCIKQKYNDDRAILVELMIRIAKSQDSESISSICQKVAEESGIAGDESNTAGELLRKRMEAFQQRSKIRR